MILRENVKFGSKSGHFLGVLDVKNRGGGAFEGGGLGHKFKYIGPIGNTSMCKDNLNV